MITESYRIPALNQAEPALKADILYIFHSRLPLAIKTLNKLRTIILIEHGQGQGFKQSLSTCSYVYIYEITLIFFYFGSLISS